MTKLSRQPKPTRPAHPTTREWVHAFNRAEVKRPATKAPTLAECRRLAEECGAAVVSTVTPDGRAAFFVDDALYPFFEVFRATNSSRSTALRMLHAALLEMKAGGK
jgi:hypothetical protein